MTSDIGRLARRLYHAGAAALFLLVVGCTQPPPSAAAVTVSPPAPGMARIWIYRADEPYQSLARPYVRFNGAVVGISEPGGAFYRDVPAGQYRVTVDSMGQDVNQFATVAVVPGQQVYVKVEVSRLWDSGGGRAIWVHPTFYTRLQPPEIAQAAIARSPFYGGS
jgi:hypothetical protein